ncbi:C40 family peptidase [Reichenbachiella carrageenanivorans]|uniref:C40 family peptidase n=1 Tax=Reichenbachiella carrageenanivorans TaxID=2979869 RepID=A0ABY6CZV3_9BACT|nr:C40 family peptidase [Reichenbachiella carrageenanivorans]UXX78333.1 C40 family peptidase [Reichenbachiella carrageenanivorans]
MQKTGWLLVLILLLIGGQTVAQNKKRRRQTDIQKVVDTAYTYTGTPYKYGGTSKNGIDCSALMQNSFAGAGYKIPRTAQAQSKYGKKVGWPSLRQGDIVFFKFKSKGEKWYHSGMITSVTPDGIYFIHASTSRGVVVSDLNADYYKKSVKAFRRVIR